MDYPFAEHPEQPASEFEDAHMYSYACLYIRQEVTKKGKQSEGKIQS